MLYQAAQAHVFREPFLPWVNAKVSAEAQDYTFCLIRLGAEAELELRDHSLRPEKGLRPDSGAMQWYRLYTVQPQGCHLQPIQSGTAVVTSETS